MKTSHKTMEVSRIEASVARMSVAAAMLAVAAALLLPQPAHANTFGVTTPGSTTYPTAKVVTAHGAAVISTGQSKFGGASGSFTGSTSYLSIPDSADWYFASGNFTIDTWVYFTGSLPASGGYEDLLGQYVDGTHHWTYYLYNSGGTLEWHFENYSSGWTVYQSRTTTLSLNTWYHIAVVRSGNSWYFFQNGVSLTTIGSGAQTATGEVSDLAALLLIGGNYAGGSEWFNGYLDELRISKGVARWTSAFTPPSARYDRDSSTVLLLHNDGANLSTTFLDDVTTGQAKATKAILSAGSTINSVSYYSHAAGNVRLAIYTNIVSDTGAPSGTRLWESGDVAVTASAWKTVNISSGTPTSLTLSAGTYWLAWQWNPGAAYAAGPSYTAGSAGNGNYLYQSYAAFPAWSGGTATTENWSIYATALKTVSYERNRNVARRILISDLLTATGETGLTFTGVNSPSAQGALVQNDATYILYNPPGAGNVSDSFTYNISDGRVGTVIITMATEPSGQSGNIRDAGLDGADHPTMTIFGVIGYQYEVQRATASSGPWGDPGTPTTITIPSTGKYPYTDTSATVPPQGPFFYRTRPH